MAEVAVEKLKTVSESSVVSEIISSDGLKRTLKVQAPAEAVGAAFSAEYNKIRSQVTLKGYRKGKAPLSRIKAIYGGQAHSDVFDKLLNSSYMEAVRKLELNIAGPPLVTEVTLEEDKPLEFTAQVEVYPDIEKVDLSGLTYVENNSPVTGEDVDRVIESLRRRGAQPVAVDRPAAGNDIIIADMKKIEDKGNVIEGDTFADSRIDLSNEMTVKEFREGLVGASAGEQKTITVNYSKDYPDKPFAGQSLTYEISIKKVQEQNLPEVNDEFAREQAGADSLEQLRERIAKGITVERENQAAKARNLQLISQVVEKNRFETPEAPVAKYVEEVLQDYRKNYPGDQTPEEELRSRYRQVGANQLRWKLLADKIMEQEKIEVLPEDTEKWIEEFASKNGMDRDKAARALAQSGRINDIHGSIREEKLLDFLRSRAKMKKA